MATSGDFPWPQEFEPDWQQLENPEAEDAFGHAAFELLKEASLLALGVSQFAPAEGHSRNSAILCALLSKGSKLTRAVLYVSQELGGERQQALVREILECAATLHYLLDEVPGDNHFDRYLQNSLVAEREFLRNVDQNVEERGGEPLPIEVRIRRSIAAAAEAGGFPDLDALPGRQSIGFPNAEKLVAALGPNAYSTYRMGSVVLHSQWSSLWLNHLELDDDGSFRVLDEDPAPRPQPLSLCCVLLVDLTRKYLRTAFPTASADLVAAFDPQLQSLRGRIDRVRILHEQFLAD